MARRTRDSRRENSEIPGGSTAESSRPASRPHLAGRRPGFVRVAASEVGRRIAALRAAPAVLLASLVAMLLGAGFLGAVGFSHPSERQVPLAGAYKEGGHFYYGASLNKKTPLYPSGKVAPGEPLYLDVIRSIELGFRFSFESEKPHHLEGVISLRALLLSKTDNWHQVMTLAAPVHFSGDRARISTELAPSRLISLISTLASQSGVPGASYTADLQPVVRLQGTVGGHPVQTTYRPVLPFTISGSEVSLDLPAISSVPGATYAPTSAAGLVSAALNPSRSGVIPHKVGDLVALGRFSVPVSSLRTASILLLVVATLLLALYEATPRARSRRSLEEEIARRQRVAIVPVGRLGVAREDAVEVIDFADLARLARFLERPVLCLGAPEGLVYVVDDGAVSYRYGPVPSPSVLPAPPEESDAEAGPAGPTAHRLPAGLLRGVGVLLAVALATSLTVTMTASNSVPTTSAGSSLQALQVGELAPSGCSGLVLTSLLTGAGTFSTSRSNALVLGSAGTDYITARGNYDCVVGGGGSDLLMGTPTDLCVTGSSNAGPCAPPWDGVTVTVSSGSAGAKRTEEQLSLSNMWTLTSLTITITVAATQGVSYKSQSDTFPAGSLTATNSTSGGYITYSWTLTATSTIPPGTNAVVDAVFNDPKSHPTSGDTWTVTGTGNGNTSTASGTF